MSTPPSASAARSTSSTRLVSPTTDTSVALSWRSSPATRAPAAASASAVACPIPDAEPVTTARLPERSGNDVDELAGGLVLEDQLQPAVRHPLLLDDGFPVVHTARPRDARRLAAAPLELDRLPLPRL